MFCKRDVSRGSVVYVSGGGEVMNWTRSCCVELHKSILYAVLFEGSNGIKEMRTVPFSSLGPFRNTSSCVIQRDVCVCVIINVDEVQCSSKDIDCLSILQLKSMIQF